jgi:hypothetical protein
MREVAGGLGVVGGIVAAVIGVTLLGITSLFIWLHFEGQAITQHTQNIRHSIGYVDAQNAICRSDMKDWASAPDKAHKNYFVGDCRAAVGQLSTGEVAPDVQAFLDQNQ